MLSKHARREYAHKCLCQLLLRLNMIQKCHILYCNEQSKLTIIYEKIMFLLIRKVVPDFFFQCAWFKSRQIKAQYFYAFTKISKKAEFCRINMRSNYNFLVTFFQQCDLGQGLSNSFFSIREIAVSLCTLNCRTCKV